MSGESLQKTEFPIYNGYAPQAGGPKAVPITLDFSTLAEIDFDLIAETARGVIDFVQAVWVDNSLNANAVTLTFSQTGQKLVVPALAQGIWPVIAPQGLRCAVTTTAVNGLLVRLILLNVPMPMTQYGPVTVNVAAVNASMTPIQKNATTTNLAMNGADQVALAANAARTRIVLQAHPNNALPIAINWGAAAVLATCTTLMPGEKWDSGTGPVDARALHAIGTAADQLIMQES